MPSRVDYNEELNQQIKDNLFTYSLLFITPADYLRQILMTCGGGYEFDRSTGEIVNFDGEREYETEMKYPEVYDQVIETQIRNTKLKFVAKNIDRVIEDYDELRGLDSCTPVEMYVKNWSQSTLFIELAKFVLEDANNVKIMTDKTMAILAMFCKWVINRTSGTNMVYRPEGSQMYKPHGCYNVPDGFPEFVTSASLVLKKLEEEYSKRYVPVYKEDALKAIIEALQSVGNEGK